MDSKNRRCRHKCQHIAKLCSNLHLNLLSFFSYFGHTFETELENLYRLEKAGLKVSDILIQHGINPYNPDTIRHTYGELGVDRETEDALIKQAMERNANNLTTTTISINGFLDRIDNIHADYKKETDSLYEQIGYLKAQLEAEKEKNRQLRSDLSNHSSLSADDESDKVEG